MPTLRIVEKAPDARLALLAQIATLIAKAKALDLPETVFLLNLAHLDLKTQIYNIDDDELQAFADAVRASLERS